MPDLSYSFEYARRPIVDLYVSMGSKDAQIFRDAGGHIPGPVPEQALVDTGAKKSHIEVALLTHRGLESVAEVDVHTESAGAIPRKMDVDVVDLHLAGDKLGCLARDLEVIGSDKLAGLKVGMLLGQDILGRCLLIHDGLHRRFTPDYDAPEPRPED